MCKLFFVNFLEKTNQKIYIKNFLELTYQKKIIPSTALRTKKTTLTRTEIFVKKF